jgi:hypothetical protein
MDYRTFVKRALKSAVTIIKMRDANTIGRIILQQKEMRSLYITGNIETRYESESDSTTKPTLKYIKQHGIGEKLSNSNETTEQLHLKCFGTC